MQKKASEKSYEQLVNMNNSLEGKSRMMVPERLTNGRADLQHIMSPEARRDLWPLPMRRVG
jgi:hypothetical protein